jgi:hypothetical protein
MKSAYIRELINHADVNEAAHNRRLAHETAELKLRGQRVSPERVFRGGPKRKKGKK